MVSRRAVSIAIIVSIAISVTLFFNRDTPIAVTTYSVKQGDVTASIANTRAGNVKACRRARLAPTIGGLIAARYVNEGDAVTADQLLLELWNDDLQASLALATSEAKAATAQVEQACLVADEAKREAQRQQTLYQKQLVAEELVDHAQTNAKVQQASCKAAAANSEVSERRIDVAQATLERTRIRAPFAGTIAEINGELAEFVTPSPIGVSTPPAIDLVDSSCLFISAPIDEVDAPRIAMLMDVHISLDAFPGKRFDGIVQRIAPYVLAIEKQARTVEVEVVFNNPEVFMQMLPGYSADVEIIIDSRRNVVRIPSEAILRDTFADNAHSQRAVMVLHDDGLLERRIIKTGIENWQFTEIITGLKVNETVVLSIDREGVIDGGYAHREMGGQSTQ